MCGICRERLGILELFAVTWRVITSYIINLPLEHGSTSIPILKNT